MSVRGEKPEDLQFTLEEIIAEVKSDRPVNKPAGAAAPKTQINIDLSAPEDELDAWLTGKAPHPPRRKSHAPASPPVEQTSLFGTEETSAPVVRAKSKPSVPEETPPEPVRPETAEPAYSGRHALPQQPTESEKIYAELEAEQVQNSEQKTAENGSASAPWRTAPQQPVRPSETPDEEKPAEDPAPPRRPKERVPYDLYNLPYDDPADAAEKMRRMLSSLSSRMLLLIPLLLTSLYMTVCGPLSLPMPFGFHYAAFPFYYQLAFCVIQVLALLLASPVTASGLCRLFRGGPTLDTAVLFAGLSSLAHSVTVILRPAWGGYLPYTCVSVMTCFFALLQKRQRYSALRRSYKAVVMGTVPTGIKLHIDGNRIATAVKTAEGGHVEVDALSEPDSTERFSCIYAPLGMVLAIGFAAVASFGRGVPTRFPCALAALTSVLTPICLLLSASAPAVRLSKRLFASGSMLVNDRSARQLAKVRAVVLEDNDLFPAGAVTLAGMKVADNQTPENVVATASALLQEVGGGLARCFSEMVRQQYIAPKRTEDLRFFETGGISAQIDGRYALLGSANFLLRMGVRVTEGLQLKNSLFLALDGTFAAIFTLRYGVQPPVYAAFGLLRRAHVQPILALRDLVTTQGFIETQFDLRTDTADYPVLSERLRLSAPSFARELPTLALLSRDGLLPAAETLAAARQLTRAARTARLISIVSAAAGMLLLYFFCWQGAFAAAAPYHVLLYLLLWALPADLISRVTTRL